MSLSRFAKSLALQAPPLQRLIAQRDRLQQETTDLRRQLQERSPVKHLSPKGGILDEYVVDAFDDTLPFKIFDGEWSSNIPGHGLGGADLFADHRITWFEEQCRGFAGKRILELGPLEGAHTCMMARGRAEHITAIESNVRAFLKCLIVQNELKFSADFRLGDFRTYLENCTDTYDLLIASGVLYHMTEPVKLLEDAARVAGSLGIWTHYYDAKVLRKRPELFNRFDAEPRVDRFRSMEAVSYRQNYGAALQWQGFCGGSAPVSNWLTRESLLGVLESLGFTVTLGDEMTTHPNGPAILIFATR